MNDVKKEEITERRVEGYLHKVIPIKNKSGEILDYVLKPIMVEFKPRDFFQVMVGSLLLATPISLTEEVWNLAESLHASNIITLFIFSLTILSGFIYFNFYRTNFNEHKLSFVKRVIGTYLISAGCAALLLTIINKCPWETDHILALKRIVLVTFPAMMSGTLSDTIK